MDNYTNFYSVIIPHQYKNKKNTDNFYTKAIVVDSDQFDQKLKEMMDQELMYGELEYY